MAIRVEDSGGTRLLRPEQFPVSIGGADADLELPGVKSSEAVAWLGLSDGLPRYGLGRDDESDPP